MGGPLRPYLAAGRLLLLVLLALAPLTSDQDSWPPSLAHSVPHPTASGDHPNIVFILADDLGYTDLGCQGSKYYETPNIDRLASQGLRFTDAYSSGPNCQPTRASLLTGQYGPRTGIYTVGSIERTDWHRRPLRPVENLTALPLDKILLPQALKKAGYATAMFGKWQLGEKDEHHPSRRGFDEAIVSAGKHFGFETHPKVRVPKHTYLADFLTDKSVDFIRRNKDNPFFLYLPHYAVHAPHQAKPELISRFENKVPIGGHHDPTYAAMIASLDESVGRIVALLDELHLAEKTLVVFCSDNGGGTVTSNAPLRGGKQMLYEGGIRVPAIFRWTGRISPAICETPITSVDMYPTMLELAGLAAPADVPLDGVSIVPLLDGKTIERDALYWHFPEYFGNKDDEVHSTPVGVIRSGPWKLLEHFETGQLELFNLKDDLGEKHNLAEKQPERARELLQRLRAWRKEIKAPMPTANLPQK